MRKLLVAVAFVGLVALAGGADEPKPTQGKPSASLKVGDPAPPLRASKWLQGEEVRKFEPGKVYVVEFWATWCGPCIWMMPHTAELQARYKDQGVTVIGFTDRDPNNTEQKVAAFVKKRGPKLKCTFAYADDSTTSDAWMKAAGKAAIPCAFVVDKAGRIAYIGNPMYLGVVLPKVIAGASPQSVSTEVGQIDRAWYKVNFVLQFGDDKGKFQAALGLQALRELDAKYPAVGNTPMFARAKLSHLVTAGEVDEAKKLAEAWIAKAVEQEDPVSLSVVSTFLRRGQGEESKELLAAAVKAAEARVKLAGDRDARALLDLADTYCAAGDKAKARACARKAGRQAGDKNAGTLINLAKTYGAIGDKAEAREHARKAGLLVGDKPAWLLIDLADAYCALGDKAEAREYARKAGQAAGGKDERTLIDLAKTYHALGDQAKARECVRKAGQVFGDKDVGDLLYLAKNSCAIGDKAGAREHARKASLLVGDKPALLINLANTYRALGDRAKAREYARRPSQPLPVSTLPASTPR
jgi:thiol-disulfide isomerase/thioredoxin/Flp pilus assembly protein TadD